MTWGRCFGFWIRLLKWDPDPCWGWEGDDQPTGRHSSRRSYDHTFRETFNDFYICQATVPIGSMYGIYASIWGILMVNLAPYMAYIRILWGRESVGYSDLSPSPWCRPGASPKIWSSQSLGEQPCRPTVPRQHGQTMRYASWGIHKDKLLQVLPGKILPGI